jgi:hypothetical protein
MTPLDVTAGRQIKLALTRREAAAALGISPATLDRLTRRRLLVPSRVTRRPLYPLFELHRFLNDGAAELAPTKKRSAIPGVDTPLLR